MANVHGRFVENQVVKFEVDHRYYFANTNQDGYATLKVHLIAGKYTITTKIYDVEVYNQLKINPVLITKICILNQLLHIIIRIKILISVGKDTLKAI